MFGGKVSVGAVLADARTCSVNAAGLVLYVPTPESDTLTVIAKFPAVELEENTTFWVTPHAVKIRELGDRVTPAGTFIVILAGVESAALQPVWPSPLFALIL
jgi:hypothetical protein